MDNSNDTTKKIVNAILLIVGIFSTVGAFKSGLTVDPLGFILSLGVGLSCLVAFFRRIKPNEQK